MVPVYPCEDFEPEPYLPKLSTFQPVHVNCKKLVKNQIESSVYNLDSSNNKYRFNQQINVKVTETIRTIFYKILRNLRIYNAICWRGR